MGLQVSTRFKEMILGRSSFVDIFSGGHIEVYSGTQPDTADDAPTVLTYIGSITGPDSSGLEFVQAGQWIAKDPAQNWQLLCEQTRTAAWFRLMAADDDGLFSYDYPRIDGSVGASASYDMVLPTVELTSGLHIVIQQFLFTLPPVTGA